MLTINVFSDPSFFQNLVIYNKEIIDAWDKIVDTTGGRGFYREEPHDEACYWFNPRAIRMVEFFRSYPHLDPLNDNPKFCLLDYGPNYASLRVISLLFCNRKDAMIEDVCCGPAKLVFYLSKLGFTNFSVVDDFSQMRLSLLQETLRGLNYKLNQPVNDVKPVVINQVGYPYHIRKIPASAELICGYRNQLFARELPEILSKVGEYVEIARDSDDFMSFYSRADKAEEFQKLLNALSMPANG